MTRDLRPLLSKQTIREKEEARTQAGVRVQASGHEGWPSMVALRKTKGHADQQPDLRTIAALTRTVNA
jgi:hypothetical protein